MCHRDKISDYCLSIRLLELHITSYYYSARTADTWCAPKLLAHGNGCCRLFNEPHSLLPTPSCSSRACRRQNSFVIVNQVPGDHLGECVNFFVQLLQITCDEDYTFRHVMSAGCYAVAKSVVKLVERHRSNLRARTQDKVYVHENNTVMAMTSSSDQQLEKYAAIWKTKLRKLYV